MVPLVVLSVGLTFIVAIFCSWLGGALVGVLGAVMGAGVGLFAGAGLAKLLFWPDTDYFFLSRLRRRRRRHFYESALDSHTIDTLSLLVREIEDGPKTKYHEELLKDLEKKFPDLEAWQGKDAYEASDTKREE